MVDYSKAIAELNRIARAELGGTRPKRHRHDWTSRNTLKRGETIIFTCRREGCEATKKVYFPPLYRCQFCEESSPMENWKNNRCPKCGKEYDPITLLDCDS